MKELLGEMLETEGNWIGVLTGICAVIGSVGFFGLLIYLWFHFPNEFPWYGWILLTMLGTVGGAIVGAITGFALYLAIVVSLGLAVAGLILGGVGLVGYVLLLIFGMA